MDRSVGYIFSQHSVDEIRRICAGIRNDVENRKMELRFLVGEHHRDIIEASDNILHMKQHSSEINHQLTELDKICAHALPNIDMMHKLKSLRITNPKKSVAAQLKLLLDVPELIWSALDEYNYTGSVLFFLLGRHVSVKLQLSGEMLSAHVNAGVMLKRQWAALDHVEATIASACRQQVTLPSIQDEIFCQALTALVLLEKQTIKMSLEEFLTGRTIALNGILGVEQQKKSNETSTKLRYSVRRRFTLVASLLLQTISTVSKLFVPSSTDNSKGDIHSLLQSLSGWCPRESSWFASEHLFEHLPDNIANFCLTSLVNSEAIRNPSSPMVMEIKKDGDKNDEFTGICALPIPSSELLTRLTLWWKDTLSLCHRQLTEALHYTTDLASLMETRSLILSVTDTERDKEGNCQSPLGHPTDLWADLYQSIFLQRLQEIMKEKFTNIYEDWEESILTVGKKINNQPTHIDQDLSSFIWSQSLIATFSEGLPRPQQEKKKTVEKNAWSTLDIKGSLGLTFFACLTGRKDLLPMSSEPKIDSSVGVSGLPTQLVWRLQRLLESSAAHYASLDEEMERRTEIDGDVGKQELNHTRRLLTPELKSDTNVWKAFGLKGSLRAVLVRLTTCGFPSAVNVIINKYKICGVFDQHVCETINLAASYAKRDEIATWKVIFDVVSELLERCSRLPISILASIANDEKELGVNGSFFVARACFTILDVYSGLGASVVAATARLSPTDGSQPYYIWADVTKLRQAWVEASRSLRTSAAQLSLGCILRITVHGNILETLSEQLVMAFVQFLKASTDDIPGDVIYEVAVDKALNGISSQWSEIMFTSTEEEKRDIDQSLPKAVARLYIPSQPTWLLHQTLLEISLSLVRLTVHLMPRGHLALCFCLQLAQKLLAAYASVTNRLMCTAIPSKQDNTLLTQPRALQLIFDIRFILRLLIWPLMTSKNTSAATLSSEQKFLKFPTPEEVKSQGQILLAHLESAVDPFDLEMSSNKMNENLARSIHTSFLLYANLFPFPVSSLNEQSSLKSSVEDTIFLPLVRGASPLDSKAIKPKPSLVISGASFELLPFSMTSVRSPKLHQPAKEMKQSRISKSNSPTTTTQPSSVMDSWFSHLSFT